VSVQVCGDTAVESSETFTGQLSAPTNATHEGVGRAVGTIGNDDRPLVFP
jgi:hypothetical protein